MAKLLIPPEQAGYKLDEGVDTLHVELAGGAPRVRLDVLGAWARLKCRWKVGPADFTTLQTFYRANKAQVFQLDLIVDSFTLTEHDCIFVAGSWNVSGIDGFTAYVEAELFVNPTANVVTP